MKILIADDDHVSSSILKRMLLQNGYDVTTVHNGAEAVENILREDGPRLLLLDWMMPELDGPEVCRAIRTVSQRGYVYIALLTSKDSKEDLVAGLEAGADDYLTKPCHSEELRARLRTGQRILQLEDNLINAREQMRFRATHDALTSLLNRGAIMGALAGELAATTNAGGESAVLLCDVDHFKSVNDTHGHPVGDQVLREVARRLRGLATSHDAVGRYGGEEFLLLLRGCSAAELPARAEAVCESLRASAIDTAAGPLRVSISVGALQLAADAAGNQVEDVLQCVDGALYRAKREGRDRAVVLSPSSFQEEGESCLVPAQG